MSQSDVQGNGGKFMHAGYIGDASALQITTIGEHQLCLVGMGSCLLAFNLQDRKQCLSQPVLDGVRVHGIEACDWQPDLIVVYGGRYLKVLELEQPVSQKTVLVHLSHAPPPFFHWVMASRFLDDPGDGKKEDQSAIRIAVGLSGNSVMIFSGTIRNGISQFERLLWFESSMQTMLYSMCLWDHPSAGNQIYVVAGTMFGSSLVWRCTYEGEMEKREGGYTVVDPDLELQGHQGAILRCRWSLDGKQIATASEDRTFAVWAVPQIDKGHQQHPSSQNGEGGPFTLSPILRRYGHKGRVWDVAFGNGLIATAGEDCTCRLWSQSDGAQLQCFKGHIGCGIWCCQFTSNGTLLTGGADSSIKIWNSNALCHTTNQSDSQVHLNAGRTSVTTLSSLEGSMVRSLGIGSQLSRIYVGMGNGALLAADIHDANKPAVNWKLLFQFEDPGPCTCIDVTGSSGMDLVFAGHCKGSGVAATLAYGHSIDHKVTAVSWTIHETRDPILGATWSQTKIEDINEEGVGSMIQLLAMDSHGCVLCWRVMNCGHLLEAPELICKLESPFRQRTVCGTKITTEQGCFVAAGDVKGNVVVWIIDGLQGADISGAFQRVHGSQPVGLLYPDPLDPSLLVSGGQDGCLKRFRLGVSTCRISHVSIGSISTPEAVFMSHEPAGTLVAGFHSTKFVLWSCFDDSELACWECGGRNRAHDFKAGDGEVAWLFASHKDGVITLISSEQSTGSLIRAPNTPSMNLTHHGREITCCCLVPCTPNGTNDFLLLTGSEEGIMRGLLYQGAGLSNATFCWGAELGNSAGGTAIKSIAVTKMYNTESTDVWLVVSVGAKEVAMAWELTATMVESRPIFQSQMISSKPPAREGLRPKSSTEHLSNLAQKRYMAVCFVYSTSSSIPGNQGSNMTAIVVASSSDGTLTMLGLTCNPPLWTIVAYLKYHRCPVLSLSCTVNGLYVCSGATDGCLAIWNVQNVAEQFMASDRHDWVIASETPIHTFENAHQSGVNCLTASTRSSSNDSECVRLVSGGDDQCLGCTDMKLQLPAGSLVDDNTLHLSAEKNELSSACQSNIVNAHASAVRGVWVSDQILFSVGLDQRVRCWHFSHGIDCEGERRAQVPPNAIELAAISCDVPDPTGLAVMPITHQISEKIIYCVVVVGRGVQVFNYVYEDSMSLLPSPS